MSKFNLALLIALLFANISQAQYWGSGIKSEGPAVTKAIDLPAFTGVVATNSGDINLIQGGQSFEVTAAQNIIDNLDLQVKDNVLHIGFKKSVKHIEQLDIDISIPSLHKLMMTGSGNLRVKGFDVQKELYLSMTGSGNMYLDNAAHEVTAKLSGSGNLKIAGRAENGSLVVTGSGNIKAKELTISDADAKVTGSGAIAVACNANLDANITGSGSIDVYGKPNVRSRITGSGSLNEH